MVKIPKITTPDILPGESGWEELQQKKKQKKQDKKQQDKRKVLTQIGKIITGELAFRIGKSITTFKGDKRYAVWRYKRKIGEIKVEKPESENEKIMLSFIRFGGIGNYKNLIQDADFRLKWITREQELLFTQKECYLCKKILSKSSEPNLYHYKLFQKRAEFLEKGEEVPSEVVEGKMTISQGWQKFKDIIEEGNRYYMSLKDTALICATCARTKGLR